jgi:exopolysaccharide production protein ExoZ
MPQIKSIQYLRAFAAVSVLLYHAFQRAEVRKVFEVGAAGVDVFFVISGFIMWTVTEQRPAGPAAFLRHRLIRIAPLYWMVTLGVAVGATVLPSLFPNIRAAPGHVLLSMAFFPHLSPDGEPYPLIVPGWTLNYEMFFYAVFALGLFLESRARLAFLSVALVGLVVVGQVLPGRGPVTATYTSPMLLEFLAGIWLARAWAADRLPGPKAGLLLIAAGVGAFAAVQAGGFYIDAWRVAIWGGPALAIVVGALAIERAGEVGELPWLRFLGDASYSIYLLHTLALSGVAKLVHAPVALILGGLVFGVLAGSVSYLLIEKPSLALLRGRRAATPRAVIAS